MTLLLLACANGPVDDSAEESSTAGENEDAYGHPRELLADCTASRSLDGADAGTLSYDAFGYMVHAVDPNDRTTEEWTFTLDELGRPVQQEGVDEDGDRMLETSSYHGDSWQLAVVSGSYNDIGGWTFTYTWSEDGYVIESDDGCRSEAVLGEGLRMVSSTLWCGGASADTTQTWEGDRLVKRHRVRHDASLAVTEEHSYDADGRLSSTSRTETWDNQSQTELRELSWSCP